MPLSSSRVHLEFISGDCYLLPKRANPVADRESHRHDRSRELTQCVTGPTHSACIELFEGFVAGEGRWKLPRNISRYPNEHCWDAVTTAAAFQMAIREDKGTSFVLHRAMSYHEPILSHWKTIIGSTGLYTRYCDTDCMVVGIDGRSLAKTEN